ncbi:hypothetical protein HOLleu_36497 [Holothuria leucospilota]|uniref:EGF-like domain-containing protein n=1 Tax=Holothuria leucospilota TaxID=206669 RepID=A0A9Q0YM08_HOLLE|nr:hypothetical protein HOLleu_36497 [Holothuria leucospilota]
MACLKSGLYLLKSGCFVVLYVSVCSGAVSKTCPESTCKNGNCTVVGEKVHCSCYNIGSGEICDPEIDENACNVLQCQNGLCKVNEDSVFYCQCLSGWESDNCDVRIQLEKSEDGAVDQIPQSNKDTSCPYGYFLCPSGKCSNQKVIYCDNIKDCKDGSDEFHCINTNYKHFEDTRYQFTVLEKDVETTNTNHMTDYTGIAVMVGIIGFLSIFFLVCTKLLRISQQDHFLMGAGLRNYFGSLHASQLQDAENVSRGNALRAAQIGLLPRREYSNTLADCTCTFTSGPQCNCLSSAMNGRLTLEASIRLMHICVEDSVSTWSDASTSVNLDPPPVYADVVSERVSYSYCRQECETPPPAYEDIMQ